MSTEELDIEELREITGGFVIGGVIGSLFQTGSSFVSRFEPQPLYGIDPYPPQPEYGIEPQPDYGVPYDD